jgi:hypothetical protein
MKNKTYYVMGGENEHDIEYIIEVPNNEDVIIMKYSDSVTWSQHVRNQKIMEVLNSGDGYRINWTTKPGKVLDYAQIAELTIMLDFLNRFDYSPMKYKILEAAKEKTPRN